MDFKYKMRPLKLSSECGSLLNALPWNDFAVASVFQGRRT